MLVKLSVAIITYNEEVCIAKALESIHDLADEIVIVDSLSTDKTRAIAESYSKVKFHERAFEGYGLQKQFAVDLCQGDWILSLDADEIVTPELFQRIKNIIHNESTSIDVYSFGRINFVQGKPVRFGGWRDRAIIRLFKKSSGAFTPIEVHEYWETKEPVGKLEEYLIHFPYKSMSHHLEKINNYSSRQAKINYERGKRTTFVMVLIAPLYQFLRMYFFKLGFLDGRRGAYLAVLHYYYVFAKYYKLYELSRGDRR